MKKMLCLVLSAACLMLVSSFAQAATVPISVFPNPAQFGTVPSNSATFLNFFVSNNTANVVTVTGMTFSGPNSGYFGFNGTPCVGIISGEQVCEMQVFVTPSVMGAFSANLVVSFAGSGSPITIPLEGTAGNPFPTVTSVSPANIYSGSPATTITLTGTGFIPSTQVAQPVFPNSTSPLPTTYVSSTKIQALVPASLLSGENAVQLDVINPQPAGGTASFDIELLALEPDLISVAPSATVAGTNPGAITLNGNNFMNGATVQWNGKTIPTTYVSSTQLEFTPTAAELAAPQIVRVAVTNPSPGGVSTALDFDVTYPVKITTLNLPANDLVWDPFAQRLYASLPSSYGSNGNSVAVINPFNGTVSGYHFVGSEPTALGLSNTAHYLYVGLSGSGSIQKMILPNFTPGFDLSLNTESGATNVASAIAVNPGNENNFAVALGSVECCGGGPLEFFTNKTLLANSVSFPEITQVIFANGTTLYGYINGTLSKIAVSSTGGTLTQQWNSVVEGAAIQYAGGLIYGGDGAAFNPQTGSLVGSYDVGEQNCCNNTQLLPDAGLNRVFVLGQTPFFNSLGITAYNLTDFTPIAVANLTELDSNGFSTTPNYLRWGSNGLAFVLESSCCGSNSPQVILVQSPALFASGGTNSVPTATSLSPASLTHGGLNFILTIDGSGFAPGSVVTWNGTTLSSNYVSSTQLQVYVPATSVASAGTANIVVTNPKPGGGTSTLAFTIN
jgi:hypothetical protein